MGVLPGIPKRIDVSSCCCFSVRTACLIFGWFGFIVSVLNLFFINEENIKMRLPKEQQELAPQLVYKLFVWNLMGGVICGALLIGVLKNKPKLMYPYIYMNFIGIICALIFQIIFVFIMIAAFFSGNTQMPVSSAILMFIGYVILSVVMDALMIYLFAPVVVHCRQLFEMKRNQLSQGA